MAVLKTLNAELKGICCALPQKSQSIYEIGEDNFTPDEIRKTTNAIGVDRLFTATLGQTTADLCYGAAEKLIEKLGWEKESIDGLLFISQTPDYKAPATACVLQGKLGLQEGCLALDINLGCSGFVYGAFLASQFIQSGACKRVIVMTGDALRRHIHPEDKGMVFIISDGCAACGFEYTEQENPMSFIMKSDGQGYQNLIIEAGAERMPSSEATKEIYEDKDGSRRSKEHLYMNGMGVFTFAIKQVPKILSEVMELHQWDKESVDLFLLHQANAYMVKYIAKRAKIDEEKMPVNINKFGNTSGATIPFLICDLYEQEFKERKKAVFSGFGVGLSWGAIAGTIGPLACAEIITV